MLSCVVSLLAHQPHDVISTFWASPDGETVLAASRGLMMRSVDGGYNWKRAHAGLPALNENVQKTIAASEAKSDAADADRTLFLLQGQELFRSDDTGFSWSRVPSEDLDFSAPMADNNQAVPFGDRLALAPGSKQGSSKVTMLVAGKHVLRSTDAGVKWKAVQKTHLTNILAVAAGESLMYASTLDGYVFASSDEGENWRELAKLNGPITHMEPVDSENGAELLATGPRGLHQLKVTKSGELDQSGKDSGITELIDEKMMMPADAELKVKTALVAATKNYIITTSNNRVLRSQRGNHDKSTFESYQDDKGIHSNLVMSHRLFFPSQAILQSCKDDIVFAAGFTGVYRSDDGGGSWTKQDTLLPLLSGVTMSNSDGDTVAVAACAYAAGCFQGKVDLSGDRPHVVDGVVNRLYVPSRADLLQDAPPYPQPGSHAQRYVVISLSPNYLEDGIVLAGSKQAMLQRSGDSGKTWTQCEIPTQDATHGDEMDWKPTVHSIAFSPSFKTDKKLFLSGWNIDVSVSTDGGIKFTSLWDAGGVNKFGSYSRLSLHPNFGVDGNGEMLAVVRSDKHMDYKEPLAAADRAAVRQSCKTGAVLYQSKDEGKTWNAVSSYLPFLDVHYHADSSALATFGDCALPSRAHQPDDYPETGLPVAQLTVMEAPLDAEKKFTPVADSTIVQQTAKSRIGGEGIAVHKNGRITMAWEEGGVTHGELAPWTMGTIKGMKLKNRKDVGAPGMQKSANTPWFQQVLPGQNSVRGKQSLVVNNEQGILVGASGFGVVLSKDGGDTWHEIFSVPQTVTHSNNMIDGCEKQRNSEERFAKAFELDTNNDLYSDAGLYCLKCKSSHDRNHDGTCTDKAKKLATTKLAAAPARFAGMLELAATGGEETTTFATAPAAGRGFSTTSVLMLGVGVFGGFVAGSLLHRRSKRLNYDRV